MLNPNEVLLEFELMIDRPLRVCQHRERCLEGFSIPAGTLQAGAYNDQDLHSGFLKLIIQAPQLGDMISALHSLILAYKEHRHLSAAIIREFDLSALV